MVSVSERWRRIVTCPAADLHPGWLRIPSEIDSPALRQVLEQLLVDEAERDCPPVITPIARFWIDHWPILPRAALFLGAQAAWIPLARGGRLCRLSAPVRNFAAFPLAPRLHALPQSDDLPLLLQAIGLGRLLQWRQQVPALLVDRLMWRFSPEASGLQGVLPPVACEAALLILAVQHARLYPNAQ